MNRDILERPFEAVLIKTRRGQGGKALSYVEGAEYVRRLNEAFESLWSFEVVEHRVLDGEVIVLGRITADGITKTAFGGSSITRSSSSGEPVSLADDLKSAATDSLKKAASLLGVGLHLYASDPTDDARHNGTPTARSNGNGHGAGNGNGQPRLTQKQLQAIWSISRALGLNSNDVRRRSMETFGVVPEHLTKADASAFIARLQETMAEARP